MMHLLLKHVKLFWTHLSSYTHRVVLTTLILFSSFFSSVILKSIYIAMYTASLQITYYIGPRLVILQVMKVDNRNYSDHLTV